MRVFHRSVAALCCLASIAGAQRAATSSRDAMLVTPDWLAQHLHDANLVILHVGDPAKYAASHIPGARYLDLDQISVSDRTEMARQMKARGMTPPPGFDTPPLTGPLNGLALEMPTAEQLRSQLEKFGISDNSKIVVYQAQQWYSPSTRVIFTLDAVGLGGRTVLLDGGLNAWTLTNHEATDVVPPPATPGKLSPVTLRPLVANAKYVHDRAGTSGVALIDARAASFYDGIPSGMGPPDPSRRLGHIPRAKNLPFDEMFADNGMLKPASQLLDLFTKAGVQPADTVVAYCHVGQQATAVLFAARSLGHPVMLYDGSFDEWNKLTEYAVELPPAKAKP